MRSPDAERRHPLGRWYARLLQKLQDMTLSELTTAFLELLPQIVLRGWRFSASVGQTKTHPETLRTSRHCGIEGFKGGSLFHCTERRETLGRGQ